MSDPTTPAREPMQFDRAVRADAGESMSPGVTCSSCQRTLRDTYYTLDRRPVCLLCKTKMEREIARTRSGGAFGKAFVFGLGAAIAGAVVYYAVIALTGLEIGLVAILIGYMVGYSVRKALNGAGGRRYQILAAVMTYWAVGIAYIPTAADEFRKSESESAKPSARKAAEPDSAAANSARTDSTQTDSTAAAATPPATPKQKPAGDGITLVTGLFLLLGFSFALPALAVLGSLPTGLLSALIIGLGIRQAWRMTAGADISFEGPLRVGPVGQSPPAMG